MMLQMEVPGIRTTSRGVWGAVCALGLLACAASKSEVRRAKNSGYDVDFAIVYNQALKQVTKLYPQLIENAGAGVISTAWHQIRSVQKTDDDHLTQQQRDQNRRLQSGGSFSSDGVPYVLTGGGLRRTYYFIRFDVHIVGGKPWKVRVRSQASEWELGAIPSEMKGGNEPPWLRGRTDALQVAIYRRLKKYAIALEAPVEDEPDKPMPLETARFGGLPEGAAKRVAEAYRAAKARNFAALRKLMSSDFEWSLGGAPDADQAVAMWQADSTVLPRLIEVLEAGCHAETQVRVTCPPAYSQQPGYLGYRAGFEKTAGEWLLTFFLRGD